MFLMDINRNDGELGTGAEVTGFRGPQLMRTVQTKMNCNDAKVRVERDLFDMVRARGR